MNTMGLSTLFRMGCFCGKENLLINGSQYTVKERLAEGGFSSVDVVEHRATHRLFALKRILCHSIDDQERALEEINYYKSLRHACIIELVDFQVVGYADIVVNSTAEALLVLPYYRNGTLHDYLSLRGYARDFLDVKDVFRLFGAICQALKQLHAATPEPLAHRDLRTANICLSDSMDPILMDLGSCTAARVQVCSVQEAQKLQEIAAERSCMTYRAPELFNVECYGIIDQRTDIWSLGCALYAILYFKSPFDVVHERGDSVNLAVISGVITYPDDSPYPNELHELVEFMLNVSVVERPFIDDVIEKSRQIRQKLEPMA